jgi:hypothetical protein
MQRNNFPQNEELRDTPDQPVKAPELPRNAA